MTRLYPLLVIASVIAYAQAQNRELSNYVNNRNLGKIDPVTEQKVLNAFVRANPNLPEELRDTRVKTRLIFVSALYQDHRHAVIDVVCGSNYNGFVEVFFNGGPVPTNPSSPVHDVNGKLNLSSLTNLNRNLNLNKAGVRVTDDAQGHAKILDAFLSKNNLPTGLRSVLRVGRVSGGSACLFIPQPNFEYEGNVNVSL